MTMESPKYRRFEWGVALFSLIIFAIIGLAFYWLVIDREPPVTITRGEVVGHERQSNGNHIIFVKWHGERHRACYGNSKRWLTGNIVVPMPDIPYPPDPRTVELGPIVWEVPIEVPGYFISTGHRKLAYQIRIDYACNPMQELLFPIRVSPPPVPFELMPDGSLQASNDGGGDAR